MATDEERLSNSEFSELIPHLPLQDLLQIEYRVNKWCPLITIVNTANKTYRCELCGVSQSGIKNLISHIDGKKHKIKAKTIKQLFHPSYTYAKGQVGMTLGTASQKQRCAPKAKTVSLSAPQIATTTTALNNSTPTLLNAAVTTKSIPVITGLTGVVAKKACLTNKITAANSSTSVKPNIIGNVSGTAQKQATQIKKPVASITTSGTAAAVKSLQNISNVACDSNLKKLDSPTVPIKKQVPGASQNKPVAQTLVRNSEANTKISPITPKLESHTINAPVKSCNDASNAIKNKPNTNIGQPKPNMIQNKSVNTGAVKPSENLSADLPTPKTYKPVSNAATMPMAKSDTVKDFHSEGQDEIRSDNIKHLNTPPINTPIIHKNIRACDPKGASSSSNKEACLNPSKKQKTQGLEVLDKPVAEIETTVAKPKTTSIILKKNEVGSFAAYKPDDSKHVNEPMAIIVKNPFAALKTRENRLESCQTEGTGETIKNTSIKLATKQEDDEVEVREVSTVSEVIVIEDDKLTDMEEEDAIMESENSSIAKASMKRGLENVTAKVSEAEEELLPKRKKIVVNPAAALRENISESNIDKAAVDKNLANSPKYQSDIVIIPTVHKKKVMNTATDRVERRQPPRFITKTFSSKPSEHDVHGLVGVEYVVKILKSRQDSAPKYECGLCELVLIGFAMQNHLTGYNHRLKFCEKHFPTAIRQYRQFMGNLPQHEVYKVMAPILAKLALAIEQHHGRDLPYECFEREFNANRHEILSKVFSCRHASEQYGPTFTHVVDSKEIDELIAQRHAYKPNNSREATFDVQQGGLSHQDQNKATSPPRDYPQYPMLCDESHSQMSQFGMYPPFTNCQPQLAVPYRCDYNVTHPPIDDETHKLMVEHFLKDTVRSSHRSHSQTVNRRRSDARSHNRNRPRSRSNSRYERDARRSISPLRENDIWQAYRHMVDQKLIELKELFKHYRNDPECHPMYNEEWQKFWRRRKDELIAVGLDHRTYNYQPEWVRFFEVRVEELYTQEVENTKIQCRERLCLPMSNDELSNPKYHVQLELSHVAIMQEGVHSTEFKTDVELKRNERRNQEIDKSPPVISVLRLMTALEEYLGSLGPKIIDLLAKALQAEKINPDQINSIILTVENSTLLETAMEKFKGLVIAGLSENSKERALRKAIQGVESLLQLGEKERKMNPCNSKEVTPSLNSPRPEFSPEPRVTKQLEKPHVEHFVPPLVTANDRVQNQPNAVTNIQNPSTFNVLAQVDKKELATKLASALAAQGKTDFDPEQLQQLIAVYTIIEKKKREAAAVSKPEVVPPPSTSMINQRSLSDTLADFLTPTQRQGVDDALVNSNQTYTAQSISNYVNMMRRTSGMLPNSSADNVQQNNYSNKSAQVNIPNYIPSEGNQTLLGQNMGIAVNTVQNALNWVGRSNQIVKSNNSNASTAVFPTAYQSSTMTTNTFETNSSSYIRTMNASRSNFYNTTSNSARVNNNSNNNINVALNNQKRRQEHNSSIQNRNQNQNLDQNWVPSGPNPNGNIDSNSNRLGNNNASNFSLWRKN